GCGHGIVANFLGLKDPGRRVIAFEQDARKAEFAAGGGKNVQIETPGVRGVNLGGVDVGMLADGLPHLNSYDEQEALLDAALAMLRPGGTLVVKEVTKTFPVKFQLTLVLDRLAYPGDTFYFRRHEDFQRLLEKRGLSVSFTDLSTRVPYAHV